MIFKALKTHGFDNISIKMTQICGESINIWNSIERKKNPDISKIANVVLVHKNYRPISLITIFSKIFERVIYNSLFNHFVTSKLFTPSQSGFLPADSHIAQFLSIIHEKHTNFDSNPPVDVEGSFRHF